MKKTKETEYPQAVQKRYPSPGTQLGSTNACPRETEYDLIPTPSRNDHGYHGETCGIDEQTFTVTKKGNCP